MAGLGKTLIYLGIVIVIVGVLVSLAGRLPWLGQLPGDFHIQRGRFTFYFPLTTCMIVSVGYFACCLLAQTVEFSQLNLSWNSARRWKH